MIGKTRVPRELDDGENITMVTRFSAGRIGNDARKINIITIIIVSMISQSNGLPNNAIKIKELTDSIYDKVDYKDAF